MDSIVFDVAQCILLLFVMIELAQIEENTNDR